MAIDARRTVAAAGVVVAIVLAVVAVWLWRSGIETTSYPPVELDGKVVSGPYELTRYSGDRIAGASAVAMVAVITLGFAARSALMTRRGRSSDGADVSASAP